MQSGVSDPLDLLDSPQSLSDSTGGPGRPDQLHDEFARPAVQPIIDFEINEAHETGVTPMFARIEVSTGSTSELAVFDLEGRCTRITVSEGGIHPDELNRPGRLDAGIRHALQQLVSTTGTSIRIFPQGSFTAWCRRCHELNRVSFGMLGYAPVLDEHQAHEWQARPVSPIANAPGTSPSHLDQLEAEAIHIIREAVAQSERPGMLYSIGKDSSVMLHLARKAFAPASPPFPLLHVDTRWKFRQMYLFRDRMARESGMQLLVHINPQAIANDINPFDHGSARHTEITKTEGLKQALEKYRFDLVFGGARRDEEKSRAKERVFSFRSTSHRWDPRHQRPELWRLYNARISPGESIRVFPLSNWTESDVWQYIYRENIPVVPLYFARERPVVVRNGFIMMFDDDRLRLLPDEKIRRMRVRFRTLGCYPLTGAIESTADTLADIVLEVMQSRNSERQGRAIDNDGSASMERKKQEGYF